MGSDERVTRLHYQLINAVFCFFIANTRFCPWGDYMFTKADLAVKVLGDLQSGYIRRAGASLADDFLIIGFAPVPLRKDQFLEIMQALLDAMPDWSFHIKNVQEKRDSVTMSISVTATHTGELNLPLFGLSRSRATGNKAALPEESLEIRTTVERVDEITVARAGEGSLLERVLDSMGLVLPVTVTV